MTKSRLSSSLLLIALIIASLFLVNTEHLSGAQTSGTSVSGNIDSSTTWTKVNSPYIFTYMVNFENNSATLTIEAGVTIDMNGYPLISNGKIDAVGNYNQPITINGGNNTPGLDLRGTQNVFEHTILNNVKISTSGFTPNTQLLKIENSAINSSSIEIYGGSLLIFDNAISDCNISVMSLNGVNSTISNNHITKGEVSIRSGNPFTQNFVTVSNNTILKGLQYGIQINGSYADISNNNISGSQYGIQVNDGYPSILDNRISDCQYGILLTSSDSNQNIGAVTPLIENNLITQNTQGITALLSGRGFLISSKVYFGTISLVIQNNTISDNSLGLYLSDSNGTFLISSSFGKMKFFIYNSQVTISYNDFQNNNQGNLYLLNTPSNVNTIHNYWGTTDTQAISQTIYDFKNNSTLGTVTFTPFSTAPNMQESLPNTSGTSNLSLLIIVILLVIASISIVSVLLKRKDKKN